MPPTPPTLRATWERRVNFTSTPPTGTDSTFPDALLLVGVDERHSSQIHGVASRLGLRVVRSSDCQVRDALDRPRLIVVGTGVELRGLATQVKELGHRSPSTPIVILRAELASADLEALLRSGEPASAAAGPRRPVAAMDPVESTAAQHGERGCRAFIGRSDPSHELRRQIAAVSGSSSSVLIRGETGTGKGLVATLIHAHSPRRHLPFVHLDCTSLAATLVESELFGHERGAFTGATARRRGRFELAGTGTIFLDEIGDLDPALQVKLLRVLQDRQYERIGGTATLSMGARVIAATNRNLEQAIDQGRFRQDLYYRLKVLEIRVPPLRTRKEDLEPLARHQLDRLAATSEIDQPRVTSSFFSALANHEWPGNVRELHNFIQRAVVQSDPTPLDGATADRLLGEDRLTPPVDPRSKTGTSNPLEPDPEPGRREILEALKATGGNVTRAARLLRVPRSTLRYRIGRFGDRKIFGRPGSDGAEGHER